ncbi:hypothetical protein [Kistimonas asteriae]|uniref:hypothetical protein n=1 Tax=Kistimonas asteriae TaxID=517724 RepID=UPI001BAE355F|nr:hypothetical protein [Kistimonas asteriae]
MSTESLQGATKRYSQGSGSSSGEEKDVSEAGKFQRKKTSKVYPTKQLRSMELASNKSKSKSLEEGYEKTISRVEAYGSHSSDIDDTNRDDVRTLAYDEDISEHKSSASLAKTTVESMGAGAEGGIDVKTEENVSEEGVGEDALDDVPELKRLLESLKLEGNENSFFILLGLMRIWMDHKLSALEKKGMFDDYVGPPLFSQKLDDTDYSVSHRKEACIATCCDIAGKALNFWHDIGSLFKKHNLIKIIHILKEEQKKVDQALIVTATDESVQAATMAFKITTLDKIKQKAVTFFRMAEKSPHLVIEVQKRKLEEFNKAFEKVENRSLILNPLLVMHPGIRGHLKNTMLTLKTCQFSYDETLQMKLICDLFLEFEIPSLGEEGKGVSASLSVHDAEFDCNDWLAELITRFVELGGDIDFVPTFASRIFSQIRKLGDNLDRGDKCSYQVKCERLGLVVNGVDESHNAKLYLEKLKIGMEHKFPPECLETATCKASVGNTRVEALRDLRGFICDLCVQVAYIAKEVSTYALGNEKKTEKDDEDIRDTLKFTTDICARVGYQVNQHLPKSMTASFEDATFTGNWTYAYLKEKRTYTSTLSINGLELVMMEARDSKPDVKIKADSFINATECYLHNVTPFYSERPTADGETWTSVQQSNSQSCLQGLEGTITVKKLQGVLDFSTAMLLVKDKKLYNRFMLPKFKDEDIDRIHACKESTIKLLEYMTDNLKRESDDTRLSLKVDRMDIGEYRGYIKENPIYLYCHLLVNSKDLQLEKSGETGLCRIFTAETANADWLTNPDSFGTEVALLKPDRVGVAHADFNWGDDNHTKFSVVLKENKMKYMTNAEDVEHYPLVRGKLEETFGFLFNGSVSVLSRAWEI